MVRKMLVLAALFSTPAHSQTCSNSDRFNDIVRPYIECSVSRARQLEASKETPENISVASMNYCSTGLGPVRAFLSKCFSPDDAEDVAQRVKQTARDVTISRIVEGRANVR